ncbi:MAG: T9SS type A sorting domain-containing protein, partial [Bacteroidales bacterium]|nr:T9SS type A sorting domain-containing protein [Bacteroidales bacterium]
AFGNDHSLTTDYFPGMEDLQLGTVELTLVGMSLLPCTGSVADGLTLTFLPAPEVTFDTLPLLGTNMPPYELTEGNPAGGIYEGPGVIDGWLHPDVAGIGLHTIRYTYTDDNGCTEMAEQTVEIVLHVNIASAISHEVTIHPNPGTGLFTVSGSGLFDSPFRMKLIDAAGIVVMDKTLAPLPAGEPMLLDATHFAPGMYYLQLVGGDGVVTRKLVISR